jgi:hypothetical protein
MDEDQLKLQQYYTNIQTLFQKYKDNDYMQQRINYHIMNLLPSTLENECKNREKRVIRNDVLTHEHQQFIQVFLSENQYYYLPNNNCSVLDIEYNYTTIFRHRFLSARNIVLILQILLLNSNFYHYEYLQ